MKRAMWFTVGILAMVLAVIGAVLPLMPTTVFVILAAFAFGKSSRRIEARLLNSPAFGPIIADWRATGAIAPRYKVLAVGMMAASLVPSLALGVPAGLLIVQAICLSCVAGFVLSRPNA